jgi:hypothetical protein
MKKAVVMILSSAVAVAVMISASADPAMAVPAFKKEFDTKYVKDGTPLATAVEKVKCNVCHKGTKKTDRNAYGEALDKLLDKTADAKDPAKIQKALDEVAKQKSNGPTSPTFGELIQSGKLPAEE